jgi:hypothetical protein
MSRSRTIAIAAFAAAGLAGALGIWLAGHRDAAASTAHPVWTEVAWPFPMDEWGQGKAYRCRAADCGGEVDVYVRGKIGFCNCTTGVADDIELERLSDFALIGGPVAALGDGQPIKVGWMNGRSRAYEISDPARSAKSALAVAFSNDCDALVATAVMARDRRAEIEPHVIGFLNGAAALKWARETLGL